MIAQLNNETKSTIAFWLIVCEALLIVVIAGYFAWVTDQQNQVLSDQTVLATEANRALIREMRTDINIHAKASAERSCAVASQIRYAIISQPGETDPKVIDALDQYVEEACKVQLVGVQHGQGGDDPNPSGGQ